MLKCFSEIHGKKSKVDPEVILDFLKAATL